MTTEDVAEALVTLTAAVAQTGAAEAVRIPIVVEDSGAIAEADLVIGVGNDVLSAPASWEGDAPDFSDAADRLKSHHLYPHSGRKGDDGDAGEDTVQDLTQTSGFDYDGYIDTL